MTYDRKTTGKAQRGNVTSVQFVIAEPCDHKVMVRPTDRKSSEVVLMMADLLLVTKGEEAFRKVEIALQEYLRAGNHLYGGRDQMGRTPEQAERASWSEAHPRLRMSSPRLNIDRGISL